MKNTQKLINGIARIAKKSVKNDVNSTSSTWIYQPKLPQKAEIFKKK